MGVRTVSRVPLAVPAGKPHPPYVSLFDREHRLQTCEACRGTGELTYVDGKPRWACEPCGGCGQIKTKRA